MRRTALSIAVGTVAVVLAWLTYDSLHTVEAGKSHDPVLDSTGLNVHHNAGRQAIKEANRATAETTRVTFRAFTNDSNAAHWAPRTSEDSKYLCEIILRNRSVIYLFTGQCMYEYSAHQKSETMIDVRWDYIVDCIHDMDVLTTRHGNVPHPRKGDVFATLTLINDTTIRATYKNAAWIRAVNRAAGDSLFPTYYYRRVED